MDFLKTKNGYCLDEVISALQKSARRDLEEDAIFWALEMCPEFENLLWSRLVVIAYEDVSALAPGNIPTTISQMKNDYFCFRKQGNPAAALVISNAIILLCESPKSRMADNFLISVGRRLDNGWKLEIPDYAKDMHTRAGKIMGRDGEHFVKQGSLLENQNSAHDRYKSEAEKYLSKGRVRAQSLSWTKIKRK